MSRKKEPKIFEIFADADQARQALGVDMNTEGWNESTLEPAKKVPVAAMVREYLQYTIVKNLHVATLTNFRYDLDVPAREWQTLDQFTKAVADVLPDFPGGKLHIVKSLESGDLYVVRIAIGK